MPALAVQEETAFAREYECPEGKHRDESAKESKQSTKRSSYRKRPYRETIPGRMAVFAESCQEELRNSIWA